MTITYTDTELLTAWGAHQAASLSEALFALADDGVGARAAGYGAQSISDNLLRQWITHNGGDPWQPGVMDDALVHVREVVSDNITRIDELLEERMIGGASTAT